MIDFRKKAERETKLSDLMISRDKLETETVVDTYKDGITITDFDICKIGSEEVAVYTIKEDNDAFVFAGLVLKNLFKSFIEDYNGDIQRCRDDFRKQGGLSVKLTRGKTKDGKREVTNVEVL